jgi:hypothetical protein
LLPDELIESASEGLQVWLRTGNSETVDPSLRNGLGLLGLWRMVPAGFVDQGDVVAVLGGLLGEARVVCCDLLPVSDQLFV